MSRDREIIDALQAIVEKHHRWGFWMCFDCEERPHDALGKVPPAVYREALESENSTLELSA